jgi:hypothetical protein
VVIEILSNTGTTDYTFGGTYTGLGKMYIGGTAFNYQITDDMFVAPSTNAPGAYCVISGPGINMPEDSSDGYATIVSANASAPDYLQFSTWNGVTISGGDYPVTFKIWYQLLKLG